MKNHLCAIHICLITPILGLFMATGCVSVKLPSTDIKKSKSVRHAKIGSSFEQILVPHVDKAWKHTQTGNTISFYSECDTEVDPSFESIQKGMLKGIPQAKVQSELNIRIDNTTGHRSVIEGSINDKQSLVDLIIYKKHQCIVILTYTGVSESFLEQQKDFERFYASFSLEDE